MSSRKHHGANAFNSEERETALKEVYGIVDRDHNGKLTPNELFLVAHAFNSEWTKEKHAELFKKVELAGGKVSQKDFLSVFTAYTKPMSEKRFKEGIQTFHAARIDAMDAELETELERSLSGSGPEVQSAAASSMNPLYDTPRRASDAAAQAAVPAPASAATTAPVPPPPPPVSEPSPLHSAAAEEGTKKATRAQNLMAESLTNEPSPATPESVEAVFSIHLHAAIAIFAVPVILSGGIGAIYRAFGRT